MRPRSPGEKTSGPDTWPGPGELPNDRHQFVEVAPFPRKNLATRAPKGSLLADPATAGSPPAAILVDSSGVNCHTGSSLDSAWYSRSESPCGCAWRQPVATSVAASWRAASGFGICHTGSSLDNAWY